MAAGMDVSPPLPSHDPEHPDASINISHSLSYWESVSSDNNGMLGGFPQTSRIDLVGSSTFLAKLRRSRLGAGSPKTPLPLLDRVADCGAGIGRITKGLLLGVGRRVDVVEPVKKFTDELVAEVENTGAEAAGAEAAGKGQVGEVFNVGLQDWVPEKGAYNLIWNQWCVGHLTDAQFVAYLGRCKDGLVKPQGDEKVEAWIVVKENLSTDIRHRDVYDEEDSSVTRSDEKFRKLFKDAGLKIVTTELQRGMPKELYPVRIYALKPE
jgi:protein N-terminal methyltransferase